MYFLSLQAFYVIATKVSIVNRKGIMKLFEKMLNVLYF